MRTSAKTTGNTVVINGKEYSKHQLCLDWFRMSNDGFFELYGFNFNPHEDVYKRQVGEYLVLVGNTKERHV